jgi:hypothetical protein
MKVKYLVFLWLLAAVIGLALLVITTNPVGYHEFLSEGHLALTMLIQSIWGAIVIVFWLVVALVMLAVGVFLLKQIREVGPDRHGSKQAVFHNGQLVQLQQPMEAMQLLQVLKESMQMNATAASSHASLMQKLAAYEARVVDADKRLAIASPIQPGQQEDVIAEVIAYEEVADEIPDNMSLLGIHPDDGSLELTDWEKLKMMWVVGSSSSGKSNTVSGKVQEAYRRAAKFIVVDQHAIKPDSLARRLEPYQDAFLRPIAVSDEDVLAALDWFKNEFERRVHCPVCAQGTQCAQCSQKIVLICDEMNRMVRNEKLKKALQEIVAICGEESRGFGMYGWFISQKCAHLKWLRDSAITVIAHKLTRFEEALLACNDDRAAARKLLLFKVGRTYVYGVDFDAPMELQQPLYPTKQDHSNTYPDGETFYEQQRNTGPLVPSSRYPVAPSSTPSDEQESESSFEGASEGGLKELLLVELSEQEKIIGEMFFGQRMNVNAIVGELWPEIKGGTAYQQKTALVADVIRKIASMK